MVGSGPPPKQWPAVVTKVRCDQCSAATRVEIQVERAYSRKVRGWRSLTRFLLRDGCGRNIVREPLTPLSFRNARRRQQRAGHETEHHTEVEGGGEEQRECGAAHLLRRTTNGYGSSPTALDPHSAFGMGITDGPSKACAALAPTLPTRIGRTTEIGYASSTPETKT